VVLLVTFTIEVLKVQTCQKLYMHAKQQNSYILEILTFDFCMCNTAYKLTLTLLTSLLGCSCLKPTYLLYQPHLCIPCTYLSSCNVWYVINCSTYSHRLWALPLQVMKGGNVRF